MRRVLALLMVIGAAGCASAPPAPPTPPKPTPPPGPTIEQKLTWILRLEDQRLLHDPPPAPADLARLVTDEDPRVRRRAALAIGHVGLRDGVSPLIATLADPDADVRQMAAFSLGLIADKSSRDGLVTALADSSPLVQGSAAEALGLVGDPAAASAIGGLVNQIVTSGALAQTSPQDEDGRRDTPAAAFRLGLYALVRLNAYDQVAAAVLDGSGQPRVTWWPVAYGLQQLADRRAYAALVTLSKDPSVLTRAFAVKGLGMLKDAGAVPVLLPLLANADRPVTVQAIRALGRIGDPSATPPLEKLAQAVNTEPHIRLEALEALGALPFTGVFDVLLDAVTDSSPTVRATAMRAAAAVDPDAFVTALSGLDPDSNWSVRATLAEILGTLRPEAALPRLMPMLNDADQRVIPAVLHALVKLQAPGLDRILAERLQADDPIVRAAAATGIGELKPATGPVALVAAFTGAHNDPSYTARTAVLAALTSYGAPTAVPLLREALTDKDWAVRLRAAMLLKQLDPASADEVAALIRPAPTTIDAATYGADRVINPSVALQVFLDTDRGTIQIELEMLDAPLTVENFVTLARKGFFNGLAIHRVVPDFVVQAGDPRGDGEGGPGYSIRDELNERPYLRGAVGMALDPWPDTGGSQFFITDSPQPQLDARYTVFGRVIAGMEVVDQIQQWDVIRGVRVWDGVTMSN